jgi:hypothetical protein
LAGWQSLLQYFDSQRWMWVVAFWGSCLVGLLAHPIFIHFVLAAAWWSGTVIHVQSNSWHSTWREILPLFCLPLVVAATCYWTLWRHLELGGGPAYSLLPMLAQTASLSVGGPSNGPGIWLASLIALIGSAAAVWLLRADRSHTGIFLLIGIVVPVAHAAVTRPPFLFPRYFLMAVLWIPFVLSVALSALYRVRRYGCWLYAIALLAILAVNLVHTTRLAVVGRGRYLDALAYLVATTDDSTLTVSSDHNFGMRKLIEFYSRKLPTQPSIQYFDGNRWPTAGPRWLILHRYAESTASPPAPEQHIDGLHFRLERMFDCAILSGWQWWCYRRVP